MDFKQILGELSPKLKGISRKLNGHLRFIDEDDLMQEMSIHLLNEWEQDEFKGKNNSYLLQSCWYYIQNYLRTVNDKAVIINLDEPIDNEETTLSEIIPDNSQPIPEVINSKIIVEKMRSNGLTKREKEVLELCGEGNTLREIGEILDISFVRASKIQKNIYKKWVNKID